VRPALRRLRRTRLFHALGRLVRHYARIEGTLTSVAGIECERLAARWLGMRLGEVCLVRHTNADDPLAGHWLMSLTVRTVFRRMGIGTALCRAVLGAARHEGAFVVRLAVRHDNRPAIRLYEKLGFRILRATPKLVPELERLERIGGAPYVAMEIGLQDRPISEQSSTPPAA
jgi:GNAT superfamily N-acetyltransferase